jgi:ASPM-SPD-2-Hydin domain-containing protein
MKRTYLCVSKAITNCIALSLAASLLFVSQIFAALTISPPSIDNSYLGTCDLTITGLDSAGQVVLVQEYMDNDASGTVSAGDLLVRQFKVTDGAVTSIAGQRNLNVPGDEDGTANGQALTRLIFRGNKDTGLIDGVHIFKISPVGAGFTPFTANLTVTQKDYGGSGISGTVSQGHGFVAFMAGGFDGDFAGVTRCDAAGNYSMKLPAGSYLPLAAKTGYIFNGGAIAQVTVTAGSFASQNLTLAASSRTISGTVRDASNTANGVPALFMHSFTETGFVALTFTDSNGNYQIDAPAAGCELGFEGWPLAQRGFFSLESTEGSTTTVTGFNIDLQPVVSLIYGSLKTPASVALPFTDIEGMQFGGAGSTSHAQTDASGNFTLGVTPGSWNLTSTPAGFLVQSQTVVVNTDGSAVQQNLVAAPVTAHLIGQVRDSANAPVPNLQIIARDPNLSNGSEINASATTDASGNFDLGVYGGGGTTTKTWALQVLIVDGPALYVSSTPQFEVQDGVDITGITYQIYNVNAHVTGQVQDETSAPIPNISAFATFAGVLSGSDVDGSGNFDLPLFGGTWNLGLSNITGLGLIVQDSQVVVTNGVDQSNVIIHARHSTTTILGTVKDNSNQAVAGVHVRGSATISGQTYPVSVVTDGGGNYSLPVFSENWSVTVDAVDLANLGFQAPSAQNVFVNTSPVTQNFVVQPTGGMAPLIAVEQPVNTGVADGGTKSFGGLKLGTSTSLTFTLKNPGTADLTSLAVTKDGTNAADFTVNTTGMLTTVPAAGNTTFTVTFTPGGTVSSSRAAAVHIASNVSGATNPYDISLSGVGLSAVNDSDSDGLADLAEYQYSAMGFDWQTSQTSLVSILQNGANAAGLFTPVQVQALNVGTPLIQKNAGNGTFTLTIGVLKSTNLTSFQPFPLNTSGATTTINGSGKLEFQFTVPDNAAFFRLQSQ